MVFKRRGRMALAVSALSGAALLLVGCGAGEPFSGPWAAEFERSLAHASSQFERDVLADGVITWDEYDEAFQRYKQCVADSGFTVTLIDVGGYYTTSFETPIENHEEHAARFDAVSDPCLIGTRNLIEPLYLSVLMNPDNGHPALPYGECWLRAGLVDRELSIAEIEEILMDVPTAAVRVEDRNGEAFQRCVTNPMWDMR